MHANVQWRHNPATGEEAPYYRLKESYRDVCGTVHSLVVLNIGFEPATRKTLSAALWRDSTLPSATTRSGTGGR